MNPFDQGSKEGGLQLTNSSIMMLETTAKWARFLSIIGFIGIGFMVIGSFFMFAAGAAMSGRGMMRGAFMAGISPAIIGVIYLIMAVVYFFPVLYLNNFARNMLNAVMGRDQIQLEAAFENMRNHYRFIGILTIIAIALYGMVFMFGIVATLGR